MWANPGLDLRKSTDRPSRASCSKSKSSLRKVVGRVFIAALSRSRQIGEASHSDPVCKAAHRESPQPSRPAEGVIPFDIAFCGKLRLRFPIRITSLFLNLPVVARPYFKRFGGNASGGTSSPAFQYRPLATKLTRSFGKAYAPPVGAGSSAAATGTFTGPSMKIPFVRKASLSAGTFVPAPTITALGRKHPSDPPALGERCKFRLP